MPRTRRVASSGNRLSDVATDSLARATHDQQEDLAVRLKRLSAQVRPTAASGRNDLELAVGSGVRWILPRTAAVMGRPVKTAFSKSHSHTEEDDAHGKPDVVALGTMAGAVLAYVLQALTSARQRRNDIADRTRAERLEAAAAFPTALVAYRHAQIARRLDQLRTGSRSEPRTSSMSHAPGLSSSDAARQTD